MRYDERPEFDTAYRLIASLFDDEDDAGRAMAVADELLAGVEKTRHARSFHYAAFARRLIEEATRRPRDDRAHRDSRDFRDGMERAVEIARQRRRPQPARAATT